MAYASQRTQVGHEPVWVAELDMDYCPHSYNTPEYTDVVASYNANLVRQSEQLDTTWLTTANITNSSDATTPPSGIDLSWKVSDDGLGGAGQYTYIALQAGVLVNNLQYTVEASIYEDTSTECVLYFRDTTAAVYRAATRFTWVAGTPVPTVLLGGSTAGVQSQGGGWFRIRITCAAAIIVAANNHEVQFRPTPQGAPGAGDQIVTGFSLRQKTDFSEYMKTAARDGTYTNVELTTGGRTIDADIGKDVRIPSGVAGTFYDINDNGATHLRVDGDATGHGTGVALEVAGQATGCIVTTPAATGSECYKTRPNCDATDYYDGGDGEVFTYRFIENRVGVPPTINAMPTLLSVNIAPTGITRGRGLGPRGKVTLTFQDVPHDDRGGYESGAQQNPDKYVDTRTYDPYLQGTFWTKWLARNPYYQGRIMRLRSGFITAPWDWTNFEDRTYFLENVSGPDANGRVVVTAKDVLKLTDDNRSTAPAVSSGYLASDMIAGQNTADLLPAGIVASEYSATGTVSIGSEYMTYTGVAGDQLQGLTRGTDGTTASTHSTNDSVQQCLRYTDESFDVVAEDLATTYGNVDATYIPSADWTAEADDYLSGSLISIVLGKPEGVKKLLAELSSVFLADFWWDAVDEELKLNVLKPQRGTPDSVTDDDNVLADSFQVSDLSEGRISRAYVYFDVIDPTEPLDEVSNYRRLYIAIDSDAESAEQYGEIRIQTFFNRWTDNLGDAIRLAERTVLAGRDTQKIFRWLMNVKDDYSEADVVELNVTNIRDATGAVLPTNAYIISRNEVRGSNTFEFTAVEDAFTGRYAFIGPNTLNDYDVESEANRSIYAFICANTEPYFDDESEFYRFV